MRSDLRWLQVGADVRGVTVEGPSRVAAKKLEMKTRRGSLRR
jgi:hypothetical protein